MIEITIFVNNNRCIGIESKGHAGYGAHGNDIVCAAVSALTINTLNSIETFTEDDFEGGQDDGYLEFHLTQPVSDRAQLLLDSLVLGLREIRKNYGNKFIEITTKEV
ncbi:ribosomal-processing cysteine protease Prp [Ruminococcus gauvreauii]|uniref:Ribosomal processing cysteine protease Prp n=1 Tax=Ruminococcus gauvreauii TaxID=438033 RepID=A0ABY5VHU8_9FIRM|nr:ribosomal-processing cysteine protease Prp [Ruminococcus gauvreauii]UWP59618.1 ribosomal-processing cysteine protease Prp [Ruminococcus gauvreauii]